MGLDRVMQILEVRTPGPRRSAPDSFVLQAGLDVVACFAQAQGQHHPADRLGKQDPYFLGELYRFRGERDGPPRIPDEQGGPRRLVQEQARSGRPVAYGHLLDLTEVRAGQCGVVRVQTAVNPERQQMQIHHVHARAVSLLKPGGHHVQEVFGRIDKGSQQQGLRDDGCDFRHG
jgi:hypothetical protein